MAQVETDKRQPLTDGKKHSGFKEYVRKKLVYLKRNPQIFPKLLMLVACCFFTFNLTPYSFAAVDITHTMPAVNLFVVTLLSFLMIIAFISVGSSLRKKLPSVIISMGIVAIQIILQIVYIVILLKEINSISAEELLNHASWQNSVNLTIVHLILLGLVVVSVATMPLYAKLLAKIKTARPDELHELDVEKVELADE